MEIYMRFICYTIYVIVKAYLYQQALHGKGTRSFGFEHGIIKRLSHIVAQAVLAQMPSRPLVWALGSMPSPFRRG